MIETTLQPFVGLAAQSAHRSSVHCRKKPEIRFIRHSSYQPGHLTRVLRPAQIAYCAHVHGDHSLLRSGDALGGSQGVCVQCGHELKQGSRFCTACGRAVAGTSQENLALTGDQEITAREHAITATMTSPPPADPVRQDPVAAEPMWPARGAYQFAVPAPQSATHGNSPASDGGSRHSPRRPHRWWPLVIPVAAILVGGVTALILFTLRTSHAARPNADGHSSAPPAITTPVNSPTSPPSPPPAEQAASRLAALLAQSASNRVSTDNAVSDVSNCGPGLSQDQQGLENSAASRQYYSCCFTLSARVLLVL
jgi:hypothetical protein